MFSNPSKKDIHSNEALLKASTLPFKSNRQVAETVRFAVKRVSTWNRKRNEFASFSLRPLLFKPGHGNEK